MKNHAKRLIALLLAVVTLFGNVTVSFAAAETTNQLQEKSSNRTYYRYREKIYTTSTEELEYPWVLYDQKQVQQCGETVYVYLDEDEEIDTTKYCVHWKTPACKYAHQTNSRYKWVLTSEAVNKYGVSHPYYYDFDTYGQLWWHYADGYRYTCCLNSSKTFVTQYYYYQWSEWSEWSETPVTATDDIEVETKTVDLFTITYDANGGTGAPAAQVKERDESLTISSQIPTKEGCSFLGWSTKVDGTVRYVPGDTYMPNESVVLYAVWKYPVIASGKCYYNLTWTLFQDGTLVISGDGYMEDCTISEIPWYSYRKQVKALVIEDGVRAIGQNAFYQCSNMTKVTIKGSLNRIGEQAFAFCEKITAVYITNPTAWCKVSFGDFCSDPKYYADYFYIIDADGNFVRNVELDNTLTEIPEGAFRKCRYLESIVIPNGVTKLGNLAFAGCDNLKSVTFQGTLSQLGASAFCDCPYLSEIEIPEGVTTIEKSTFYNCRRLTRVVLPSSIKSIQSNAFMDCVSLKEIHIPKNVTTIESSAFSACHSLKKVFLPRKITAIKNNAFYDCFDLETVYYSGTEASKKNISIGTSNEQLSNATWYYGYAVAFNANGGLGVPNSQFKETNKDLVLSTVTPMRAGYEFVGWATTSTGEVEYLPGDNYTKNSDVILYAVWKPNTYIVTFNANGGSGAPAQMSKTHGESIALHTEIPIREGYSFSGWSTASAGEVEYLPGDSYVKDADIVLYAVWKPNTYVVTFDANGGSGAPAQMSKTHDESLTLSLEIPTREGYTFLGWSTTNDGEVEYDAGSTYEANAPVVLFAVWTKNKYTVSFDANGGTGAPENQTKIYDEELVLSNVKPVREGYTFLGWSTSKDGEIDCFPGGVYSDNASVQLYATWAENSAIIASGDCGRNLIWVLYSDGELVVDGIGDMYDYKYWNNKCTSPWNSWRSSIKSVNIKDGVTSIGDYAFYWYHDALAKVEIASTVTVIGDYSFYQCYSLTELTIDEGVTQIGESAFEQCFFATVTIPNSVTTIGYDAFNWCSKLTDLSLGKGIELIDYYAFSNCYRLKNVWCSGSAADYSDSVLNLSINDSLSSATWYYENCLGVYQERTHTYSNWTNHNDTQHKRTCECGDAIYADHCWDDGVTTKEPTHTSTGKMTHTCTVCNGEKTTIISVQPHKFSEWTSVNDSQHSRTCECGKAETEPHNWDDGIITKQPTQTVCGERSFACENCLATKTESIYPYIVTYDANGGRNTPAVQVKIPETDLVLSNIVPVREGYVFKCWTTHEAGEIYKTLSVAESEGLHYAVGPYEEYSVSCSGAKSISLTFDKRTEFDGDYLYVYDCYGNCFARYTRKQLAGVTITVPGDSITLARQTEYYTDWGFAVTSAVAEFDTYSVGDSYVVDKDVTLYAVWDVCNHSWDSGLITVQPTHTIFGERIHTCEECNATKTEQIAKTTEHTYGVWTEVNTENHQRICACGEVETKTHDWNAGVITVQPTHTSFGERTYTCGKCSATKTEQVAKTPDHAYGSWIKVDSETHRRTCACGDVETEDHNWDTGVITVQPTYTAYGECTYTCIDCGATKAVTIPVLPKYRFGDANDDGVIDGLDVIRLKKYLANYNYETGVSTIEISAGADANGDGAVDGLDVIRLKKYLANFNYATGESAVPLGPQ